MRKQKKYFCKLSISNQKNHYLKRKTAIIIEFRSIGKTTRPVFADRKLQVDQRKETLFSFLWSTCSLKSAETGHIVVPIDRNVIIIVVFRLKLWVFGLDTKVFSQYFRYLDILPSLRFFLVLSLFWQVRYHVWNVQCIIVKIIISVVSA